MLDVIRESWGWAGLVPTEVIAVNHFGNVIVRAADGAFWRICPESLSCGVVAHDAEGYDRLLQDGEFQTDWQMQPLVDLASAKFGPLPPGRCYYLKLPAVLGGEYNSDNLGTISLEELIGFAGEAGRQIKDVPDGTQVMIEWKT